MQARKAIFTFVFSCIVLIFVPQALARTPMALGMVVDNKPAIPPTVEGPGYFLPDSPFFFLDQLKQTVRLAFAVTPEQRAQVFESIAGERLAEARIELIKNNMDAVYFDLEQVRENTKNAAQQVQNAQNMGKNVTQLAGDINSTIKTHQDDLDFLANNATGELRADVRVVQAALADAKSIVENSLPQALLLTEVHEDLLRQAEESAHTTADDAQLLKASLDALQLQATEAAKDNLKNREVVLHTAIAEKDQQLIKNSEAQIAAQQREDDLTTSLQEQASTDTQIIVGKAEEVAQTVQTAEQIVTAK